MIKNLILFIIFFSVSFISFSQGYLSGGELTYKYIGNDQYRVKLVLYRDCESTGQPLPPFVNCNIYSPSANGIGDITLILDDQKDERLIKGCFKFPSFCEGGNFLSVQVRSYEGTISIKNKNQDWTFDCLIASRSNRYTNLATGQGDAFSIIAKLDNTNGNYSSPQFENDPKFYVLENDSVIDNPKITADSIGVLFVSLQNAKITPSRAITYLQPFSNINPISTQNGFNFNDQTGEMIYTPSIANEKSAINIQAEYIVNGKTVAKVNREMQIIVLNRSNTKLSFSTPDTIFVCSGFKYNGELKIIGNAKVANYNLYMDFNNLKDWGLTKADSGKKYKIVRAQKSDTLIVSYPQDTLKVSEIDLTFYDDICPTALLRKTFYLKFLKKAKISYLGSDTFICNQNKIVKVKGINTYNPYSFSWIGINNQTDSIRITSGGEYPLNIIDGKGCKSKDTMRIVAGVKFGADRYCINENVVLFDTTASHRLKPIQHDPNPKTTKWLWNWSTQTLIGDSTQNKSASFALNTSQIYNLKLTTTNAGIKRCFTKPVYICPIPNLDYNLISNCSKSLVIKDLIKDDTICGIIREYSLFFTLTNTDTTIKPKKYSGYWNKDQKKMAFGTVLPGIYTLSYYVKGNKCTYNAPNKTVEIFDAPNIDTDLKKFVYRCDKGESYKQVINAKATVAESIKYLDSNVNIIFTYGTKTSSVKVFSGGNSSFEFDIKKGGPNPSLFVSAVDARGCSELVSFKILPPFQSRVDLVKYYCKPNDNVKINNNTLYNTPAKRIKWNANDGQIIDQFNFDHVYQNIAQDSAIVRLINEDSTGCLDSASLVVYLGEIDPNQFSITDPNICFGTTMNLGTYKNKFINSWYFRYTDTLHYMYDIENPRQIADKYVVNKRFGVAYPTKLDTFVNENPGQYISSQYIFYNEKDTLKNFEINRSTRKIFIPRRPTNVCRIESKKTWNILPKMIYKVGIDSYNQCFDSLKIFTPNLVDTDTNINRLDTLSWLWTLKKPRTNEILEQSTNFKKFVVTKKMTDIATIRNDPKYPPYNLVYDYTYKFSQLGVNKTCRLRDSTKIGNEKVKFKIEESPQTSCLDFTRSYYLKNFENIGSISVDGKSYYELESTFWDFGDNTDTTKDIVRRRYKSSGKYAVTAIATNHFKCKSYDTLLLDINPSPSLTLSIPGTCIGSPIIANAVLKISGNQSILKYYWFDTKNVPLLPALENGFNDQADTSKAIQTTDKPYLEINKGLGTYQFSVSARNNFGCYFNTGIPKVEIIPKPIARFNALANSTLDKEFIGNEPIDFIDQSDSAVSWKWSMGNGQFYYFDSNSTNRNIQYTYPYYAKPYPKSANIYNVKLTITNKYGCIVTDSNNINLNAIFVIPNAFSPNNDGLNDIFSATGKGIKYMNFKIFNRWGEIIYEYAGKAEKEYLSRHYHLWNGEYKGIAQPSGTYVYQVNIKTGYGDEEVYQGNVTLIR